MPRLGINITDNVYYAPDRPFVNLADRCIPYFSSSSTVYTEDALGFPLNITNPSDVFTRVDLYKGHPNGVYNFTWDGPANAIEVDFGVGTNGSTSGTFTKSSDNLTVLLRMRKSVTGLRVWHSSDNIAQTFSTDFLEFMKDFKTIRFMNWCSVNYPDYVTPTAPVWSKRRKKHSFTQSRPSFETYGETAWELIAELCNTTRSACWICIHHLADATWIANVAKLMHKELDADIPLIVEHSNEVWNGAFAQNVYSRAAGVGNMADTDSTRRGFVWHAKRTALIGDIFRAHCKGRPLDITLGLQAATYGFFDFAKSTDPTGELAPALLKCDSYSIAPYFGGYVAGPNGTTTTQLRDLVLAGGVNEVFSQINTQYALGTEANPWTQMTQWATRATADAKVLRGYEGGQHVVAQGSDQSNSALTVILTSANRDSRMYNLHLEYLDGWKSRTSDAEMCLFNACQAFDQYGSWGLEEYQNQKVIAGSSAVPKYQAVLDWIGGKTSTTGDPTGTFFRAVTALPAIMEPNTVYAVKATTDSDCQIVITDRAGMPVPLNTGNVYVDVFETPGTGTWTKRAGAVMVKAIAIGGGNGGGSGRRGAAGSDRYGGGGGGGGGIAVAEFPASVLGATEFVWVGDKGVGGAAQTTNDTNGNPGSTGYPSAFGCVDNTLSGSTATGTKLKTGAGIPAGGGTNAAGAAGTGGAGFPSLALIGTGSSGGAGSNGAGAAATASGLACPGGGGGGGINTSNTAAAGGAGGGTGLASGSGPIAFYVGGAGGAVGVAGEDGANASTPVAGSGGGGGGASTSAVGGDGGAGGIYGAGGGGGGASANGFASGKGGDGANGCVVVVSLIRTNEAILRQDGGAWLRSDGGRWIWG